jgi:hypothetical protein
MFGTQLAHILAYGRYTPLMIYYGILYGIDVHGYMVDVLFMILYSLLTYLLLHDVWYGTSLMHGQVQGSS